jgi:hypothetical protein
VLPRAQSPQTSLLGRRFGFATDTSQKGKAQTILSLGRTLLDSGATPTWGIPTLGDEQCNFPKRLEHQIVKELLPMTTSSLRCSNTFYTSVGIRAAVKDCGERMIVDM